ncbi:MAG: hypothetical protein NTW68_09250 [candidate division NC10 bacterium]|nr:hypothetical protein [candidate division NC10 bacterium]
MGRRRITPRCLPGPLILALLLGFFFPPISKVQAGSADTPKAGEAQEADLDFSDLLYVRNPLPATDAEVGYRFERISDRTDAGSALTHKNGVSLAFSLAATEWLGLSMEVPYQFLSIRPADGSSSTQVNNLGDLTAEGFVTLLRDPGWRLAVAAGLDIGVPTGSVHDGTGGQWTLTPFVNAGIMLGPVQLLADVNYMAELRSLPDAGPRKQELMVNLGVAYPVAGSWILPFLTVNGVYAFSGPSEIRHRGQLYLSLGARIGPAAVAGASGTDEPPADAKSAAGQESSAEPWWKRLSLAIGPQFPLTSAREFEWGITTALKLDF